MMGTMTDRPTGTAQVTAVVLAHPYAGSFSRAVLDEVLAGLKDGGRSHSVIDLCADGFDPTYDEAELALFHDGGTLDPLVTRYQETLERADSMILIAPIWWNDVPAILKGFLDKVMKQKWAYAPTPTGTRGILGEHIGSVTVLTTSTSPTWYLRLVCGNPIGRVVLGATFRQLGVTRRRWINLGRVRGGGAERRQRHLARVHTLAASLG